MTRLRLAFCSAVLVALFLYLLACGNTPPRQLVSATVMPATATASSFPNGMVQFTATGTFDRPPSPVVLNPAMWQLNLLPYIPQTQSPLVPAEWPSAKPVLQVPSRSEVEGKFALLRGWEYPVSSSLARRN